MKMNGARILVEELIHQGVRVIFGYPGGAVLDIYNELYLASDRIGHVLTAHEQGAAHAADGYARASGKTGVVLATSGPGATNLVTGIANAYLDSVPMVAITGNVAVNSLGKDSFQEVKRTTRDEPDYNKLMNYRLNILREHGLGLKEIQETISKIDPLPGAREFLDKLKEITQVIIISDTFSQFAGPLMKKLGYPTIFCNSLVVSENGEITDFKMRCEKSKYTTVKALQSCGFETIASGDSHNDLAMIEASKAGFLFRTTEEIKAEYPQIPAYETYDELLEAIKKVLA